MRTDISISASPTSGTDAGYRTRKTGDLEVYAVCYVVIGGTPQRKDPRRRRRLIIEATTAGGRTSPQRPDEARLMACGGALDFAQIEDGCLRADRCPRPMRFDVGCWRAGSRAWSASGNCMVDGRCRPYRRERSPARRASSGRAARCLQFALGSSALCIVERTRTRVSSR